MRRLLAPALLLAAGTAAGLAPAATITGTNGPDLIRGSAFADGLFGRGGNDRISGLGGNDLIDGGPGSDMLAGNAGDDRIVSAGDAAPDDVACGSGRDIVDAGLGDSVDPNCEVVSRQLSRDTLTNGRGQHETEVEPDSFAYGSTIVTVFQLGRVAGGGASSIGFATSRNAGRSWTSALLPGLTIARPRGAGYNAASAPRVGYDARHRTWLAASLAEEGDASLVAISRSGDGRRWRTPTSAIRSTVLDVDKPWIACDNGARSRFRGRCYVAYTAFPRGDLELVFSRNGGRNWSNPVIVTPNLPLLALAQGAQPAIRPDGSLVLVYDVFSDPGIDLVVASRSNDGGTTFGPQVTISQLQGREVIGIRAPAFPSTAVDRRGTVYVGWSDCVLHRDCEEDDIVLATSPNGVAWTAPRAAAGGDDAVDRFMRGLDVTTGTDGRTRVAITY